MPDIILYGISNCDTVRKARRWLDQHEVSYRFHDFRKDGISPALIKTWLPHIEWEALINKRGRSWRELAESDKQITSAAKAVELCSVHPTVIKRPVLVKARQITIGFDPAQYSVLFAS